MAILRSAPYIVIALLLGYVIYLKECTPAIEPETITVRDTIYKPKIDTIYKPYTNTIYKDTGSTKIVTITKTDTVIDTVLLIQDYLSKVTYTDTILNDSKGFIVVNDTIYKNRIISRYNQIKLYKKRVKNHYFIGGGLSGGMKRVGLQVSAAMLSKRKNLYSFDYDFINKEIKFSYYIIIR